jgi:hypothetical protein
MNKLFSSIASVSVHGNRVSPSTRPGRVLLAVVAIIAAFASGPLLGASTAQADTSPPAGTPATVSADVLPTWQINGVVWNAVTVGNTVYATGRFTKARPPGIAAGGAGEIAAGNIFAFNITTGNPVPNFSHSLNAQGLAISASPDGTRVYVGGDFTTVDGQTRNRIAAFNTATGALDTAFHPSVSNQVAGIAATNTTVYVGGNFSSVGGSSRTRLAAMTASTGALTSWAPTADDNFITTMVLSPDASRVIVGGHFTTLNHVAAYGMGALSTATGATQPWAANAVIRDAGVNGAITHLKADATQIYGGGYAFGSGSTWEGTFALNPTTGAINWLNDCHGDTYDVFAAGQALYSVGHAHDCSAIHSFPDTSPRTWHRALAFTTYPTGTNTGPDSYGWNYNGRPASGLLHWYPTVSAGTFTGQSQGGWALTGNNTYVVMGGEFPKVNGINQQGLVRFALTPTAPNKVAPQASTGLVPTAATAGSGAAKVSWTTTWDMDNQLLTYRVLRDGVTTINTSTKTSSFWQLTAMSFTDTGLAHGSTHSYKVQAIDPAGNVRYSGGSNTVTIP